MKEKILKFKNNKTNVLFQCNSAYEKLELLAFLNHCGYVINNALGKIYENEDCALFIRIWHEFGKYEILIDIHIPINLEQGIMQGFCNEFYLFTDFKFDCQFDF